jgi:hypothetical protein
MTNATTHKYPSEAAYLKASTDIIDKLEERLLR